MVPELSIEAHVELVRYSYVLVVGLWPITHPLPVVQQLADDPLFAIHRRDFEADLANGMGLVADGMLRQSERGASPSKLEG